MKTCACMCVCVDGWMKPFEASSVMTAFKRFFLVFRDERPASV